MDPSKIAKTCKRCNGLLSYTDVPGVGILWQCPSCHLALEAEDGTLYLWRKPAVERPKQKYEENKKKSSKRCPECRKPMWEVVMPDFGSRWQCEECRLTVFATGGIQHWKKPKPAPTE